MEMIICDPNSKECSMIESYVHDYYRQNDVEAQIRRCKGWQELYEEIRQKGADIIIIAYSGVKGLDIITGLKVPTGKLIWFSDLDFSIQAYRLNVSYFNLLPITKEKVLYALHHINMIK